MMYLRQIVFFAAVFAGLGNISLFAEAPQKYLIKTVTLNFEPAGVLIAGSQQQHFRLVQASYRVLKAVIHDEDSFIVSIAGHIPPTISPQYILIYSQQAPEGSIQDRVAALQIAVENQDLTDLSRADFLREEIVRLRERYSSLDHKLQDQQKEIYDLKSKAAELARINRLVVAQTTVASLARKKEGLIKDRDNFRQLLEYMRQQPDSLRLASSEAALSRDLQLLAQDGAGTRAQKSLVLSQDKREAAKRIVAQAQGLDIDTLKRQLEMYKLPDVNPDIEEQSSLAEEYARMQESQGLNTENGR